MSRPDLARLAAARAKFAALRTRRAPPSRRKRWVALALLLVLLALLQDCRCNQAPPQPCVQVEATGVGAGTAAPEPPDDRRMSRRDRAALRTQAPSTPPWLASFRMQVAARSLRLARCFVGADRPGRLRWTTTVEPSYGAVSEHVIEPTLQGDALTAGERACALAALGTPPYRLEGGDARTTPSRVSLVLEF